MANIASNSVKLPSLMSIDTPGAASSCDQMRERERLKWRAQCDVERARSQGGAGSTHYSMVRGEVAAVGGYGHGQGGVGSVSDGSHAGEGREVVPVPHGELFYRDEGIDDLVRVLFLYLLIIISFYSLTALMMPT